MAYFEPNGILRLLAGVKISEGVTYRFSSRSAQTSFFEGKARVSFDDLSYISHDGVVTLEVDPAVVKDCDYIMFQNPTQEGKWWYGKISGYRWVNSAPTCEISYEIDWYQSYQFDIGYSMCTIEREGFSNEGYQMAVENPWRRDVLELCTPEDIIVDEGQFNVEPANLLRWPQSGPSGNNENQVVILMTMSDGWMSDLTEEEKNTFNDAVTNSAAVYNEKPATVNGMPNIMRYIAWTLSSNPQPVIDLLTLWGLTSEISSIMYVPLIIVDNIATGFTNDGNVLNVEKDEMHPKLNRGPFMTICVSSPDGNVKNLKPDNFNDLALGNGYVRFLAAGTAGARNSMAVSPIAYGDNVLNLSGVNLTERIEFSDFAQVPYNVDGYLTYLSSQYSSSILANNASQQVKMGMRNALWGPYDQLGQAAATIGTISGAVKGGIGAILSGANPMDALSAPYANYVQNYHDTELYNEAQSYRKVNPNKADISVLNFAKPACLADSYIAPAGGSIMSYLEGEIPQFIMYVRRMNDIYRKQIAQYFMRYGMKSNRIGIPYSANYSDMHFDSFRDAQVHFCKTSTCYIDCNNSVAEAAIESMYNGGVLFLNGG